MLRNHHQSVLPDNRQWLWIYPWVWCGLGPNCMFCSASLYTMKVNRTSPRASSHLFRGRVYSEETLNQILEVCSCSLVYKPEPTIIGRLGGVKEKLDSGPCWIWAESCRLIGNKRSTIWGENEPQDNFTCGPLQLPTPDRPWKWIEDGLNHWTRVERTQECWHIGKQAGERGSPLELKWFIKNLHRVQQVKQLFI